VADINEVTVEADDDSIDLEEYDGKIQALIFSYEGTLPGSRGFGLSMDFISKSWPTAVNILAGELADKVEEFLPEIKVTGVETEGSTDGELDVTIHIGRRN
jgi:hypothetical protein